MCKKVAVETVGLKPKSQRTDFTSDCEVVTMSEERRVLLNQLNTNRASDKSAVRTKINKLKNNIKKRLKLLKEEKAHNLADEITNTDNSRRMFEATRELISSNQKPNVIVKNDDDETVENDTEKASIIRNWFSKHYTGDELPLEPFVGEPCPLDSPITVAEVTSAAKCLKNNKAGDLTIYLTNF